ncbi:alpha/beta hydrolase [Streptomyces sp. NBC_00193]|uniref:alpha/beta fold hydrolase n=1 Tax=unclassified Streptomyces TaxID=2593676 RepID=UPI002252E39D|nr:MULTISPECIES: alpha/beta hydrolase [unclassified Streptomyces]MCX5130338.1 alpha/beta hydrolase [Streptomyces sp. NBC_00347]MCX5301719.1 alpha/beta hydrolase [Streptomyces sp. NBC_00193]
MTNAAAQPTRATLTIDGRALSYLDFGGAGRPLLALHGHLSEGSSFAALAAALGPEWRVIAPDQRGHGDSDRAAEYTRAGYLADLVALLAHLGIERTVVLGHSLGGINGYHLAAAHPELVEALVDVDAPAELPDHGAGPLSFVRNFPYTAPTREELLAGCGPLAPALAPALRPLPGGAGWRLPFHPQDTIDSEQLVHGDHWKQWLATDCPALLVHGLRSQVVSAALAREMTTRRPGTVSRALDTDHFVQLGDPEGFAAAVREFLAGL